MQQRTYERAQELHSLAAHAYGAAAVAHGKGDHFTAHEMTLQAHEHSRNAKALSDELQAKSTEHPR